MTFAPGSIIQERTRLNFVSGKGGVGKTAISCSLALKASREGLETLLFAINPTQAIETFFGLPAPYDDRLHEIFPRLWVQNLDQLHLFDDFMRKSLKIRKLYETILNSQVYQYFTAVAPGIKELITQELIIAALNRKRQFERRYFDMIIVDSPATGHGLSWFSVPEAVRTTFRVGPLNKKAIEIKEILSDENLTSIHLVTLPEEMPVNETIEFQHSLTNLLGLPTKTIFLNAIFPLLSGAESMTPEKLSRFSELSDENTKNKMILTADETTCLRHIRESAEFYLMRRKLNEHYRDILKRKIAVPICEIPMFFEKSSNIDLMEKIAEFL